MDHNSPSYSASYEQSKNYASHKVRYKTGGSFCIICGVKQSWCFIWPCAGHEVVKPGSQVDIFDDQ